MPDAAVRDRLQNVLEAIAESEAAFAERFYEIFLGARPDAAKLFGAFAFAEQEAMFHQVLESLLGWIDEEEWLAGNLEALGQSHREYGVEADMFGAFVEALVTCAREQLSDAIDDEGAAALRTGIEVITEPLRVAIAEG